MTINFNNINIGNYIQLFHVQPVNRSEYSSRGSEISSDLYCSASGTWGVTRFCCSNDMPFFSTSTNDAFNVQRGQHSPHTLPKMANCLVFRTIIHQIEKVLTTRHLVSHWVELKKGSPVLNTQIIFIFFLVEVNSSHHVLLFVAHSYLL